MPVKRVRVRACPLSSVVARDTLTGLDPCVLCKAVDRQLLLSCFRSIRVLSQLEPPRAPQEPQRDPQEHQKGAQERPKTQQSSPRRGDIRVFEGGRVGEYVEMRVQMGFGGFVRPAASPSARLRNTCSDGLWWLHEALCLAIHALGEQFGIVEGSPRAKMGAQGCPKKSF